MLARLGLHDEIVTNARVNFMPSRASRSMLGVPTFRLPYVPVSSHARSSAIISTTLGRAADCADTGPAISSRTTRPNHTRVCDVIIGGSQALIQGLIRPTPHSSKSAVLRVAMAARAERPMAAICASKCEMGRPAR